MPLTLKKVFVPLLAATAISGCSKPESGDLLMSKQEQIIAALNTTKPSIDVPDNTQNCMATLMGNTGKNIKIIVACDGKVMRDMTDTAKSKGDFLAQVHGIAVLRGKFMTGQNTCITIEENNQSVTNCPESQESEQPIRQDGNKPRLII